jgi:probable HAF family extracellular repeat protein
MQRNRYLPVLVVAILGALALGAPVGTFALGDVYNANGFENPPFVAGSVVGQDGWAGVPPLSPAAAVVSTDLAFVGRQSIRVRSADLVHQDFINEVTHGYHAIGSYRRSVNYDVAANGFATPVALGLVLGVPGLAQAQFNFTTIDVPGSTRTSANGNSTYQIAGDYDDADGHTHGFVLSNGVFTAVDVPGAVFTSVNGIGANGPLTGTYQDATRLHAYFWSNGVFTTLDPPGSIESQGGFVNAQGKVVGGYRDGNHIRHAFSWSNGVFTTIDPPNGHLTLGPVAFGINDPGQVVGTYVDVNGNRHGFLLSGGVYTALDVPDAAFTVAEGISNAGQIVGLYFDAGFNEHGFVLSGGIYTTIDVPNATATTGFSINAHGVIVGSYDDAGGVTHGYVGTPAR